MATTDSTTPTLDRSSQGPFQSFGMTPPRVTPTRWCRHKHIFDRALAVLLLIPAAPMIILLFLVVRLTSKGPGIFAQVRVGRHNRLFTMYKIRTMTQDAETQTGAVWAKAEDPRVTWIGKIIRRLHVDEFPQLINVLKGEMALIGPRPERPEIVPELEREIPGYSMRHTVAPGISGLAQCNLPADSNCDDVRRKLVLDFEYIQTASLPFDLRILACTCLRLFLLPGDAARKATGMARTVTVPPEMDKEHDTNEELESEAESKPPSEEDEARAAMQDDDSGTAATRRTVNFSWTDTVDEIPPLPPCNLDADHQRDNETASRSTRGKPR